MKKDKKYAHNKRLNGHIASLEVMANDPRSSEVARQKAHEAAAIYRAAEHQPDAQGRMEMMYEGNDSEKEFANATMEANLRCYTGAAMHSPKICYLLGKYREAEDKKRKAFAIHKPMREALLRTGEQPDGFYKQAKKYIRLVKAAHDLGNQLFDTYNEWVDSLPADQTQFCRGKVMGSKD